MLTENNAESKSKFYCDIYDFTAAKNSNYGAHFSTCKHKNAFLFTFQDKKNAECEKMIQNIKIIP